MGKNQAFTLIELLVVISISTLIIAILLPALSMARESAKTINCLSHLRQIGLMFAAYQTDHSAEWVGLAEVKSGAGSIDRRYARILLAGHYTESPNVFVCPSFAPYQWDHEGHIANVVQYQVYGIRYFTTDPFRHRIDITPTHRFDYLDLSSVQRPSEFMMTADTYSAGSEKQNWQWQNWSSAQVHLRHQDHASILMLDGHVERLAPERIGPLAWREAPNLVGGIRARILDGTLTGALPQ